MMPCRGVLRSCAWGARGEEKERWREGGTKKGRDEEMERWREEQKEKRKKKGTS
jgi:hypothetical protein